MPRLPIDYKKSIIYKIINANESLIYVGSTTDFRKRKAHHKSTCNNENCKDYSIHVYQMIRDNGGWNAFTMIPVKEFQCESKIQLLIEEEQIRKQLNANLNKNRAYTTEEQNNAYTKEYRVTHKEQIQKQKKEYKEAHTEEKKIYDEAYRESHKAEINKRGKAYREAHKEKIKEYKKAYYKKKLI